MPLITKPPLLVPNLHPIRRGLVLDLPFFERRSGRALDFSPFHTHGVFVGSPTPTVGKGGIGLSFDNATTDRITVTTLAGQNNVHRITVETLAIMATGMSNGGRLFHKGATGIFANRYWEHGELDAGHMYFAGDWTGGQGAWRITAGAPSADVIHQIVSTYDDASTTNDPLLYVDGSSVGVTEVLGPSGSRATDTAIAYLGGSVTSTESWSGKIFYIRVWNRILSPSEVRYLYYHPYALYNVSRPVYGRSPSGTLFTQELLESITLVDTIIRATARTLTETVTPVDTLIKLPARTLSEVVTPVDTVIRTPGKTLTDVVTPVDSIVRAPTKTLTDTVSIVDTILRVSSRTLSEVFTVVDTVLKTPGRILSESVTVVDSFIRETGKILTETLIVGDGSLFGISLNGTSEYMSATLWSTATTSVSMGGYFRSNDYTRTRQPIISNGSGQSGGERGYALILSGNGTTDGSMYLLNHLVAWINLSFKVQDNNLHHIMMTRSSLGVTKVYLDGVLKYNASPSLNTPNTASYLGKDNAAGGFFKGQLYDQRFFNYELTQQEVVDIIAGTDPATPALNWYKFVDMLGTDSGSSPKNGTVVGSWIGALFRTNLYITLSRPLTDVFSLVDTFVRTVGKLLSENVVINDVLVLPFTAFVMTLTETITIVDTFLRRIKWYRRVSNAFKTAVTNNWYNKNNSDWEE